MASIPLELLLKLKDEASGSLDRIKSGLGGINLSAVALGGAALGGVVALGKGLLDAADAAAEEEVGIAALGAAVRATGADWGAAEAAIETYLAAELRRTALDDGAGREAIMRLTTATGDYRTALDLMGLTQDLAAAKKISLAAAAEIVGKVHEGNTGILSRYGITLAEGTTATEALGAMQERFAGQAEAYGNTQQGAAQKYDVALGNLKETVGGMVLPVLTALMMLLADLAMQALPWVEGAVNALQPVFLTVFGWIRDNVVPILTAIVGYVIGNWPTILSTAQGVLEPLWALVQAIFSAIASFITANQDTIKEVIGTAWGYVETTVRNVIAIVQGIIQTALGLIEGDWGKAWQGVQTVFDGVWSQIQNIARTAVGLVKGIFDLFGIDLDGIWSGIRAKAEWTWNAIKTGIETPILAARDTVRGIIEAIQGLLDSIRLPHIPTPHISVWTEPGALGIPIPHVDVQWYQRGLDAIIAQPTLIGVGEAGPERVQVTPLGGRDQGQGVTVIYNDYRPNGGAAPDLYEVARALEWRARVRAGA